MKRRIRIPVVAIALVVAFTSCATIAPISEENRVFEDAANVSITFMLRGLYSLEDENARMLYNDVLAGDVTFIHNKEEEYVVQVERSADGTTTILVGPIPSVLEGADRQVYFTALAATAAQLAEYREADRNEAQIGATPIETIRMYLDSGYDLAIRDHVEWVDEGLDSLEADNMVLYARAVFRITDTTLWLL
ncbi:MAG: hypothetical protein ACOC2Y_07010 [Spirochaetota bacterium]